MDPGSRLRQGYAGHGQARDDKVGTILSGIHVLADASVCEVAEGGLVRRSLGEGWMPWATIVLSIRNVIESEVWACYIKFGIVEFGPTTEG